MGDDSAMEGYTGPRTTWANEMNFIMNYAPGVGSIARPVDQQSSALPLCYAAPESLIDNNSLLNKIIKNFNAITKQSTFIPITLIVWIYRYFSLIMTVSQ